jgi:hypothetical protein
MRLYTTARLGVSLVALTAIDLPAQQIIPNRPECASCRLVQDRITTIGGLSDDDALAQTFVIDRDAYGRVYVAPYFLTGRIKVFEPTGKLRKVIGRRGSGPGEFQSVRAIRVVGDTLYV